MPEPAAPVTPPHLSVVIPAFNEETRLAPTLDDTLRYLNARGGPFEIIVVDDGSTDGTVALVEGYSARHAGVRVLSLGRNRGKGCAVRTGMLEATGARRIFADADGSTPIVELARLEHALDAGAQVAIGSRALPSTETLVKTVWYRKVLGRIFNGLVNLLVLPGIADTQCGFKLFTAEAAGFLFSRQQMERYSFDVELLYLARRAGMRIEEVPVNWENIPISKVNLVWDSSRMLFDVLRLRLIHRRIPEFQTTVRC